MIVYQVFAGKTYDNFRDLTNKVKYIKLLGCDTVWSTPFLKAPTYHKYDALSLFELDPQLGTKEDFKRCTKYMNDNGIKFMMDFVVTHMSNQSEWFRLSERRDSKFDNFFVWSDTKGVYQKDDSCFDQSGDNQWHWSDIRQQYYLGAFCAEMPNLNLDNPIVRNEIKWSLIHWHGLGVDCLRLDSVKHIHSKDVLGFWKWFRQECNRIGIKELVGECWSDIHTVDKYSNEIGSCFDFPSKYQIQSCINENRMRDLPYILQNNYRIYTNMMGTFLCNHDQDRIASELQGDIDKIKYATAFLLTIKGDVYIYYGDENGTQGVKWYGDEHVRTNIDYHNTNMELFELYKDLIHIRKDNNILKYGDLLPVETNKRNAACFERRFYNKSIYIIIADEDTKCNIPKDTYNALYTPWGHTGEYKYSGQEFYKGIYVLEQI